MTLLRIAALISLLALGLAQPATARPAGAQPQAETIAVRIAVDKPGPTIDRNIFGQFAEMLGEGIYGGIWVGKDSKIPNVRGIRSDVVAALRALKVPNVRWPGGCFADDYDWRDGIGPEAGRVSHINQWGNVIEPNSFGTHEFMDLVEQIGREAYISVNVGSGTPQSAANWLEYMTADHPTTLARQRAANGRAKPWKVKFVGLGNENWGCGGQMSADHYAEEMKRFATYVKSYHPGQMNSHFQPNPNAIRKIAVGQTLGETAYTHAVMKAWKERTRYAWNIAALSLHYYTGDPTPLVNPSTDFGEKDYAAILNSTLKMDAMLTEHKAIMDRYDPGRQIALSIDEWGVWLKPTSKNFMFLRQQNSLRDGIAAALNLNIFARHADRVRMANIAQMVNVIQSIVLTDGPKMLLTPTYHVFRMYIPFQDARLIPVEYDPGSYTFGTVTLPQVDIIAARTGEGEVWLALTNLDPARKARVSPHVSGLTTAVATGEVLTAPQVDSINQFGANPAVAPTPYRAAVQNGQLVLELAPKSVTVVRLQ